MKLAQVRSAFRGAALADILVPGFIDTSVHPFEFTFQFRDVFLKLDSRLVRLATIRDEGRLEFSWATSARTGKDLGGFSPSVVSVWELHLPNHSLPAEISGAAIWGGDDSGHALTCGALELEVHGQKIFFDPTYDFGFRIGDERQHAVWVENLPGDEPARLQLENAP